MVLLQKLFYPISMFGVMAIPIIFKLYWEQRSLPLNQLSAPKKSSRALNLIQNIAILPEMKLPNPLHHLAALIESST